MTVDPLFTPVRLGALNLDHRIVMAPLTRLRSAQPGDVPQPMNARYYAQRANPGGLLITEATDIAASAHGYPGAPGIYSAAQIDGWKAVTDAVHAKGARIVVQLWHTGRVSHSSMRGGALPVAPSAVAAPGQHWDASFAPADFEVPRALDIAEIPGIVADFRQAVINAKAAGFDGVEIHGANGYLINQFLEDGVNLRTDRYGGSIENRARFLFEVVDAAAAAWSADRIGVRLSPGGVVHGMKDSNPTALYDHVAASLKPRGLAYLHIVEPRSSDPQGSGQATSEVSARLRGLFGGGVIAATGFDHASAQAAVARGDADAVAFGRFYIANPDLVERFRVGAALNPYDRSTFYGGTEKGYTDYPTL
jgi:N-ethylmaleimide reductase